MDTTVSARQALDLKALLQEMAEENERLAAAMEKAEQVKARVDAKLAFLDTNGNGIPDVLDEARFELEWMLKMQPVWQMLRSTQRPEVSRSARFWSK